MLLQRWLPSGVNPMMVVEKNGEPGATSERRESSRRGLVATASSASLRKLDVACGSSSRINRDFIMNNIACATTIVVPLRRMAKGMTATR